MILTRPASAMKCYHAKKNTCFIFCYAAFLSWNCHSGNQDNTVTPDKIIYKIDTAHQKGQPEITGKPPIINIEDTIAVKQIVIYMKDSTRSSERIGTKLAYIFGKALPDMIKKNNLVRTGHKMAWFKTSREPFFFEAGIPVNKRPGKLARNVFVKEIGGDSAVVAHFYGPYEMTYLGYSALADFLKENHKKPAGSPYEIYIGEPIDNNGNPVDPYKLQTDIVFPHH